MKVLFLSISAGQGHHQAAKAATGYLTKHNVDCVTLDALQYINPMLGSSVSKGYLMSTKFSPGMYGRFYRMAEKRDTDKSSTVLSRLTNNVLSRKLIKYIDELNPDVIVCTHVFAAVLMTYITRRQKPRFKTIGIVTDFTIHPYWEDTCLDYYITASELLSNQAAKKGIPYHKIKPYGIPIDPKFSKKTEKIQARKMLNIPDKRTVFVMSGSMGFGKVVKIISDLDKSEIDFQIVSVCGYNKRLKKNIDRLEINKKIYNYGFVDNVDVIMDASDCIFTKPGGLTTSESLAKGIPIMAINPIPGQEDRNMEFLLNNGAAVKITSTFPADDAVYQFFTNKEREKIQHLIVESIGKPNSARDFGELVMGLCNEVR